MYKKKKMLIEYDPDEDSEDEADAEAAEAIQAAKRAAAADKAAQLRAQVVAERHTQRERAAGAPRHRGIAWYVSAPVSARDDSSGAAAAQWYAARLVAVDAEQRTARVHFLGWHARYDFTADWDSPRLRACAAATLVRHRTGGPISA
jgi:hypothetical protein